MIKEKILIIKTGYSETLVKDSDSRVVSLGDVLRITPLLNLYKDHLVTWVADKYAFPLLEDNPYIDRLWDISDPFVIEQLKTEKFDTLINLEKIPGICALADKIHAWKRYGFRFDSDTGKAEAYDNSFEVLAVASERGKQDNKNNLASQNSSGLPIKENSKFIGNEKTSQQLLFEMVGKTFNGEDYVLGYKPKTVEIYDIGLNTTMGSKWPSKSWSIEKWARLKERLEKDGYKVSQQDQQGPSVTKNINGYMDWINSCKTIVTIDSAGTHLALALKKKTIALFGPTSHKEYEFYGRGKAILPSKIPECLPCFEPYCHQERNCMEDITVNMVYDEVIQLINGKNLINGKEEREELTEDVLLITIKDPKKSSDFVVEFKENLENDQISRFSKKNFAQISSGNDIEAKFSKEEDFPEQSETFQILSPASNESTKRDKVYSAGKLAFHKEKLKDLKEGKHTPPITIRFKPINKCNHKCFYCSYAPDWEYLLSETIKEEDMMPWEKIEETIDSFKELGVKAITWTGGGEPLLHPQADKFLQKTLECGLDLAIITNGQLLTGKRAEILSKASWVRVSTESINEDIFHEIRKIPKKMFHALQDNLRKFAKMKDPSCEFGINFVITKINWHTVYDAAKYFKEMGFNHIKFSPLFTPRGFEKYHEEFKEKVIEQLNRAMVEVADDKFHIYTTYENDFKLSGVTKRDYDRCFMIECLVVVGADSNVYTCQDKAYSDGGRLGTIKDKTFKELWYDSGFIERIKNFNPRKSCNHHCAKDGRNITIGEIMGDFDNMDDFKPKSIKHVNFV